MILAIDPGNKYSAYVVYENGVCHEADKVDNNRMLELVDIVGYDIAAIEQVRCMGMAVGQEVFDTVFFSGQLYRAINARTLLIPRSEVKMFLCGSMRAKDANIRQSLIDRFGAVPTLKNPNPNYPKRLGGDEWSALAVAVTAEKRLETGSEYH